MATTRIIWRTSAMAVTLLMALSCTDSSVTLTANQQAIEDAKSCLALARYECARDHYAELLPDNERETAEKVAGTALAELGIWVRGVGETVVEIARIIEDESDAAPGAGGLKIAQSLAGNTILNRALYNQLVDDWERLQTVIEKFDAVTAGLPEFAIDIPEFLLTLEEVPVVVITGEMHKSDFDLLQSILHSAASGMALVLAMDFEFPLIDLVQFILDRPECDDPAPASRRRCWALATAFAINNSDTVLTLQQNRGEVFRDEARKQAVEYYQHTAAFLGSVEQISVAAEDAGRLHRAINATPRPGGGAWVDWTFGEIQLDSVQIRNILKGNEESAVPPDYELRTVRFLSGPENLQGSRDAATHLSDGKPERVPVATTILPQFTTGLEILLQSEVVKTILQVIFEALDPEFTEFIVSTADQLDTLYSDYGNADAVHNLFEFLLPPSLAIDFRPLYESDRFLRTFVPDAVTIDVHGASGLPVWEWLIEWECDDDDVELAACPDESKIVDSDHFQWPGAPVSMPADGIKSPVAYVGYSDPGFGGMLWLDPNELDPTYPTGVTNPDLEILNRLLIEIGIEMGRRLDLAPTP